MISRPSDMPDAPSFEAQGRYWGERWGRERQPNEWQLRRAHAILSMVRALPLEHPRILDLGCGTGWFTAQLSELGESVGLDLSEEAIKIAREDFPQIRFLAGNVFESAGALGEFDLVACQEVIAHVTDQRGLVERICGLLRPGGYLAITTVNRFVINRSDPFPDPDVHLKNWLDTRALKQLLVPHFRVLRTTSIIPMGHRGVLRLVNSYRLNSLLALLFSKERIESWKERAHLGYCLVALAQKRRSKRHCLPEPAR